MGRPKPVSVSPILEITNQGEIERVKAAIREKYGFDVTDAYAADLIDFVNEMSHVEPRI